MKRLVAYSLADGTSVTAEVDEPDDAVGTVRVARPGEISETARLTFEEALSKIKPAAEYVITCLRAIGDPPDQIDVTFGIKLSAQAGAVIASASAEANYQVSLTWKKDQSAV